MSEIRTMLFSHRPLGECVQPGYDNAKRGDASVYILSATFAVNTPLFAGGAAPGASAELRPPSVKGVLRFWWRALAWSRHTGDLQAIRQKEAEIFGAAGDDKTGRQASFLLRVRPTTLVVLPKDQVLNGADGKVVGVGARYFGYGLMGAFGASAGKTTRPCLKAPFEFTVELVSRGGLDSTVVDALKLMGLLGGLGSRTRRGWGSLSLLSLKGDGVNDWQAPRSAKDYERELRRILSPESLYDEPPYSAFCKQTRIDMVGEDSEPLRLLNTVGEQMLRYRSWGKNGKILNGEDSEKEFQNDHDWFVDGKNFDQTHPRRVIFGLPHNYFRRVDKDKKTVGLTTATKTFDRRASPLLVHVHWLADQSYIAVLTVLRSAYLPEGEKLWVWRDNPKRPERIPPAQLRKPNPDWGVLTKFVDRFPNRTKVLP
jgi:CRISPR-associated protein Cmr1